MMTIHQLEPAMLFDSNIYLLLGEKTVLIDTGTGFKVKDTIRSVKDLLGDRKLDMIIITHRHYDHVGGLDQILKEFGSEVYAGTDDAIPLREGDSESTMGTAFGGKIVPTEVKDLTEGQILDLGEHRLRTISTPGHTIGSISLYDEVTGALFTGDTVFVDGVGRYDLPTASREQLVQSLRRLSEMDFDGLYPGHGPYLSKGGKEHIIRGLKMVSA